MGLEEDLFSAVSQGNIAEIQKLLPPPRLLTRKRKKHSNTSNRSSDMSSPEPTFAKSPYKCGKSSDMLNVSLSEPSVSTLDISLPESNITEPLSSTVSKCQNFLSTLSLNSFEHNSPEPSRGAKRTRLKY